MHHGLAPARGARGTDVVLHLDDRLRVAAVVDSGRPVFGTSLPTGVHVLTLLPDLTERALGRGRRRDEDAVSQPIETTARRLDGTTFLAEVTISFDERDRQDLGPACRVRDLSALSATELQLRRERGLAQLTLAAVTDAIFSVDAAGTVQHAYPAATGMLRRRREDLVGRSFEEVTGLTRRDGRPFEPGASPVDLALADGAARRFVDATVLRRDGFGLSVHVSVTPLLSAGEIVGAVVTVTDLTERLALERRKDEFLSVVSHELKTPLTSIRGALGMLLGGVVGDLSPEVTQMLEVAMSNTHRLSGLVSDILDLERLAAGRMPLDLRRVDLRAVATDIARDQGPAAQAARVELVVEGPCLHVVADVQHLATAIGNLVSNAIKFSAPGQRVRIVTEADDDGAWVRVHDEGRGIPADKVDHVFERFSQVDVSDATVKGGTGLGLAITAHIVAALGGRVHLVSELGEGSTFSIRLPGIDAPGGEQG
jgi:PAS domain S-box-containing protein